MTTTPKKSALLLEQAKAYQAQLETALSRSKQHEIDLEAERETLAKDHRAAATHAAIEGESPPPAPMRLAQAQAEITTCRAVLSDLETRLTDARAAVVTAEQNDIAARRRAVVGPLEKQGQKLWLEIAERYTQLVDLAGAAGLEAVHALTTTTGPLHPEFDPILRALKTEGLDFGDGSEIDIIPDGEYAQNYTDGIVERHNGEPRPDQGAWPRI